MSRLLVRLFPAGWRARYGDEFEALLDERPLGPFDVADVLLSAIDSHVRSRAGSRAAGQARGAAMTLRSGGIAAILGGVLWLGSLVGASTTQPADGQPWLTLFIVALFALVVAMIGLSADQGRQKPRLIWAAVAVPIIGAVISAVGLVGMATIGDRPFIGGASPWSIWVLGTITMIIGSGLFALASLRIRYLSRAAAALLAIGAVAALPLLFGVAYSNGPGDAGSIIAILGIVAFSVGWIWLGIGALRADRSRAAGYREAIP